jgi:hypothetical protein
MILFFFSSILRFFKASCIDTTRNHSKAACSQSKAVALTEVKLSHYTQGALRVPGV